MSTYINLLKLRSQQLSRSCSLTIIEAASVLQVTYTGFRRLRRRFNVHPVNPFGIYYFNSDDILFLLEKLIQSNINRYFDQNNFSLLSPAMRSLLFTDQLVDFITRYSYIDPLLINRMVTDAAKEYCGGWDLII